MFAYQTTNTWIFSFLFPLTWNHHDNYANLFIPPSPHLESLQ